jgi:hypothetical protein
MATIHFGSSADATADLDMCDWYVFGVVRCRRQAVWRVRTGAAFEAAERLLCAHHAARLERWGSTLGSDGHTAREHLSVVERLADARPETVASSCAPVSCASATRG